MTVANYALTDRYLRRDGEVLLTGIHALCRLPIEQLRRDADAGLRTGAFLAGYPGSPLAGFDLEVVRAIALVPELRIVHRAAVNEELAASSVMGSQFVEGRTDTELQGVTGFWYGKAPGVDRAGDALRHAMFAGTSRHGGAVAIVGDDPANKSSTLPSSSAATLVAMGMPLFYPGTVAECIELGLHAVAASRATGLWSALKVVTPVADGSGTVGLPVVASPPVMPTVMVDGRPYQCHPSGRLLGARLLDIEREIHEVRIPLAREYGVQNALNQVTVDPADAWIGIVASGFTYHELLHALHRLGLPDEAAIADAGIRLLHLRMPVPFDPGIVRRFGAGLEEIVVVEGKDDTIETRVRDALYGVTGGPVIVGKENEHGDRLVPSWGLLDADTIGPAVRARLDRKLRDRLAPTPAPRRALLPLAAERSPFFCSGCPHNWSTKVPEGAEVGAGIGCHTMVLLMDEERVGHSLGLTAMGNEGAQWTGVAPFVEADHLFQNIGDGTYFHSGQLAIQHAVAVGNHITFKLLHNGTVAMTGGQTPRGQRTVPEIAAVLLAQGVEKVVITTDDPATYRDVQLPDGVKVRDRTDIVEVQEELRATPGVTVLIHDQACAAETRRLRRRDRVATPTRRVVINHRICEGCGDCGQVSNCLSVQPVETAFGRKTTIDQASCNYDYSCLEGDCPAFMTVDVDPDRPPAGASIPVPDPADPEPVEKVDRFRIRLAGIGGTGIVTAAQVLATAAMLDGWHTRGLDQTGLSQKAGPVVSDVILRRVAGDTSNLISSGEADLVLAFDALVAAGPMVLDGADPQRTTIVASTHQTPTGSMVTDPTVPYPGIDSLIERFAAVSRVETNRYVDAWGITGRIVGSATYANLFLLGVAVQAGRLPVAASAIGDAITLNGIEVEANLAAFAWGRQWVADPEAALGFESPRRREPAKLPDELSRRVEAITDDGALRDVVSMLAADLVDYQHRAYAAAYLDEVASAARAEQSLGRGRTALTEAVARNLHKLMAYKDEYEVARLMLLPDAREAIEAVAGPGSDFSWQLHPPMLRALGMDAKLPIPSKASAGIALLRKGKRLRGTRFDPFGRTELRREERRLPSQYRATLARVYAGLTDENHTDAVAIAALPDLIRGYEALKERRINEYRVRVAAALDAFSAVPSP